MEAFKAQLPTCILQNGVLSICTLSFNDKGYIQTLPASFAYLCLQKNSVLNYHLAVIIKWLQMIGLKSSTDICKIGAKKLITNRCTAVQISCYIHVCNIATPIKSFSLQKKF